MDAGWENIKSMYLLSYVYPVYLKTKFSCIHPLQKCLVATVSALDPERAMNCMGYSLLCIQRKVLLSLLIHCYDLSVSTYQRWCIMVSIQPPWLRGTFLTQWINDLCLRSWRVVNMFCLFSGQRQSGLVTTQRKSGFLKIGWGGQ